MFKSVGCSSREPEFASQNPPGDLHPSVTPGSRALMLSSGLCRHCTHIGKTLIHKIERKKSLEREWILDPQNCVDMCYFQ